MPDDPLLSHYGHPILPCGYNSWEDDGDEVNGSGVNEPIWPTLTDLFIALEVLIITPEMLEVFDGCADWAAPHDANEQLIPGSIWELAVADFPTEQVIEAESNTVVVAAISNVIVFPAEDNTLVLVEEGIAA